MPNVEYWFGKERCLFGVFHDQVCTMVSVSVMAAVCVGGDGLGPTLVTCLETRRLQTGFW